MRSVKDRMQGGAAALWHAWTWRLARAITTRPDQSRRVPSVAARQTIALVMLDDSATHPLLQPLVLAGYTVRLARGLPAALELLGGGCDEPALLIVVGLPAAGLCHTLRAATPAPILLLLPEPDDAAMLDAFQGGVDDCQQATIGAAEAVLRVRTLLRRHRGLNAG